MDRVVEVWLVFCEKQNTVLPKVNAKLSLPGGPGSENSTTIMFYYVYILQSIKNQSLYIGYTSNLKTRLKEHNRGFNFSTKINVPWQLIHYEAYLNEKDVKRREKYLKTNQGSRLLKRMMKEYFYSHRLKN